MPKNSIIERELSKINVKIESHNENTNEYFIPKVKRTVFNKGEKYLFKLDKSLLSASGNELLVVNWNKGTFPTCEYLKAQIVKILGDKIFVGALYYDKELEKDLDGDWTGWLPINKLEIVRKL